MRTLVALLSAPLAAGVALLVIAPGLMWLGLGNGPREDFWRTLPAVAIVGTGISYVITLVAAPLIHFALWTRDRVGIRDYVLTGFALGAGVPLFILMLDGFKGRMADTLALAILGASAGSATAAAFWTVAVKHRLRRGRLSQ